MNRLDKQAFIEFNKALTERKVDKVLAMVAENVSWRMIGSENIKGKASLEAILTQAETDQEFEIDIDHIVLEENKAALNGTIHTMSQHGEWTHYSFCDFYLVDEEFGKIKEIISYVQPLSR